MVTHISFPKGRLNEEAKEKILQTLAREGIVEIKKKAAGFT